jgi:hypothetical protein
MKKFASLFALVVIWLFTAQVSFAEPGSSETSNLVQQASTGTAVETRTPTISSTATATRRPLITNEVVGSWSEPSDITDDVTVNWRAYPLAVCDRFQNVHILWADNITDGTSRRGMTAALYYRNDIGGTFSAPKDVLVTRDTNIHFPAVALSTLNDTLHLIWVNTPNGTLYYSSVPLALAGDARAWNPPLAIDYQVFNGAIAVDRQGGIHLFYGRRADDDGLENEVAHVWLDAEKNEWSSVQVIYQRETPLPSQIRTEAAIDGRGRFHLGLSLRSVNYGEASEVGYLRSPDGGETWDLYKEVTEADRPVTFQGVEWIAPYTFGDDEVHLTWHSPRRMHMWSSDGGKTWTEPTIIMQLGAAFGGSDDLVKDSAGTLRVIVAVQGGVYSAPWVDGEWGTPELIDGREIDNHGQRIVVCQGNKLHVLFYDRTGEKTAWYASRRISAPALARRPIPTLTPIMTTPDPTMTEEVPGAASMPTETVVAFLEFNGDPTRPTSPIIPILFPALIAASVFIVLAGIIQYVRIKE